MESNWLRKITREFNKCLYPCKARTIKNDGNKLIMEFRETFIFSSCAEEHFESFRILLEEKGEKYITKEIKHIGRKFIVEYEKEDGFGIG